MNDIGDKLKEITVGILCLTRNNIDAPWILFEAGALSKGLTKSRVCPLLIDLSHQELKPPLANFNATMPARDDMLRLIKTINSQGGEKKLADERVDKAFNIWWPEFEKQFSATVKEFKTTKAVVQRPVPEMVTEILELARSIHANVQQELTVQLNPRSSGGRTRVLKPAFLTDAYIRAIAEQYVAERTDQPIIGNALGDAWKAQAQIPNQPESSSSH